MTREFLWLGNGADWDATPTGVEMSEVISVCFTDNLTHFDTGGSEVISEADTDDYGKMTITRMIGSFGLINGGGNTNRIHVGIAVVPGNTTASTAPDPRTDYSYPWLYKKVFHLLASESVNSIDSVLNFDIRSQRKIGRQEKLVIVIDDDDGGYGWSFDCRCLVKLS